MSQPPVNLARSRELLTRLQRLLTSFLFALREGVIAPALRVRKVIFRHATDAGILVLRAGGAFGPNDGWRDENQEIPFRLVVASASKCRSQPGDITHDGNLRERACDVFPDQAAQRERMTILDQYACLHVARVDDRNLGIHRTA